MGIWVYGSWVKASSVGFRGAMVYAIKLGIAWHIANPESFQFYRRHVILIQKP